MVNAKWMPQFMMVAPQPPINFHQVIQPQHLIHQQHFDQLQHQQQQQQQLQQQQQQQQQQSRHGMTVGCMPVLFDIEKVNNAEKGGLNPLVEVVKNLDKWGITVTDPLEKRKVACPLFKIWVTNGLLDSSSKSHTHSICILYQNGRCKVENNCNQIHVDRVYYAQQRTGVPCCAEHYDFFTSSLLAANVVQLPVVILIVTLKGVRVPYIWPANLVSLSLGLAHCPVKKIDGRDCMIIESSRVCQVWQGARCSYGKECNYVHLCRKVYENLPKDAAAHRVKKAPSSVNSSASTVTLTPPASQLPLKTVPLPPPLPSAGQTARDNDNTGFVTRASTTRDFISIQSTEPMQAPPLTNTESMEDLVSHLPLSFSRESSPIAPVDDEVLINFASKFTRQPCTQPTTSPAAAE